MCCIAMMGRQVTNIPSGPKGLKAGFKTSLDFIRYMIRLGISIKRLERLKKGLNFIKKVKTFEPYQRSTK